MPKMTLTQAAVSALKAPDPSGRQVLYWDSEFKGFGVLVSGRTNSKAYVVQRDINGNTRRITVGATNILSLPKARDKAVLLLAEFAEGIDPKRRRKAEAEQRAKEVREAVTLKQALDHYVSHRVDLKPQSLQETQKIVTRYLSDWESRPLRDIDRAAILAKHKEIAALVAGRSAERARQAAEGRAREEGGSKVAVANADAGGAYSGEVAANSAIRVIRGLYNHARREMASSLPENPASAIKMFKEERRTGMVRPSEMQAFYQAVRGYPNKVAADYITLVLFTGFRREEAAALTWSEIDFSERVIHIPHKRTKAGRALDLPMSDVVFNLLSERRKVGLVPGGWVFPANSGSGHISEPRSILSDIAEKTGISITVHDLRRTFITVAESCDISTFALKGLVNHSLGGDVTAGYIVSGVERLRAPMQKVADRLKALCGIPEDQ